MENVTIKMNWPDGKQFDIGVVIGRFQVPYIHTSHKYILDSVEASHKYMLIMIGVAPVIGTKTDPLDYLTRFEMLRQMYPMAVVVPMYDSPSNELWSAAVDAQVSLLFPTYTARLYGGRDSFIDKYSGNLPVFETPKTSDLSGTEMRNAISVPVADPMFRTGAIYNAVKKPFPILAFTVDVALVNSNQVLLGTKKHDKGLLRFPGGFVDIKDTNLEHAARRELHEETGIVAEEIHYIGSFKIPDWRYMGENEALYTTFFKVHYSWGKAKGADDLDGVFWTDITTLRPSHMMPNHRPLLEALIINLNKEKK